MAQSTLQQKPENVRSRVLLLDPLQVQKDFALRRPDSYARQHFIRAFLRHTDPQTYRAGEYFEVSEPRPGTTFCYTWIMGSPADGSYHLVLMGGFLDSPGLLPGVSLREPLLAIGISQHPFNPALEWIVDDGNPVQPSFCLHKLPYDALVGLHPQEQTVGYKVRNPALNEIANQLYTELTPH